MNFPSCTGSVSTLTWPLWAIWTDVPWKRGLFWDVKRLLCSLQFQWSGGWLATMCSSVCFGAMFWQLKAVHTLYTYCVNTLYKTLYIYTDCTHTLRTHISPPSTANSHSLRFYQRECTCMYANRKWESWRMLDAYVLCVCFWVLNCFTNAAGIHPCYNITTKHIYSLSFIKGKHDVHGKKMNSENEFSEKMSACTQ